MWLTVAFTILAALDFVISFSIFIRAGKAAAKNPRQARCVAPLCVQRMHMKSRAYMCLMYHIAVT